MSGTNKDLAIMEEYMDNTVSWFGLDDKEFTNDVNTSDLKVGELVWVFDLSNYVKAPDLPVEARVVKINPDWYIVVEIDGEEWECYCSHFGKKIKD